jgi:hypothetical protein
VPRATKPAETRLAARIGCRDWLPGLAARANRGGRPGVGELVLGLGWRGAETAQLGKGALMFALAESYDLLALREAVGLGGERGAGSDANGLAVVQDVITQDVISRVLPERGFGAAQAAVAPFDVTERIDQRPLGKAGGEILVVALSGEFGQIVGGLVEDNRSFGVDAELQGVEAGCGLALGGARAAGFLCVKAVGGDLFLGCHKRTFYLSVARLVVIICEVILISDLE